MGRPLRALFVEDVEHDAVLVARELRRGGFDVTFERVDTPEAVSAALDGAPWDVLISDYSLPRFNAPMALALVKERGLDLPFIIVSGTIGEDVAVEAIHAGAHDFMAKGKLARLCPAVERELRNAALRAEQAKMQEKLVQSQKMETLGQLAGGIAHDFNNILAVIMSYGSFVRDALAEGDERRADMDQVLRSAERAVGLTHQLLAFCRQQPAAHRPIDLNESLAHLESLLTRTVGEHIALDISLAAESAVVRIDPGQFDQIVLNLVVNARDAMLQGGTLRVELGRAADGVTGEPLVRLRVTDSGTGMDERTQQRAFEPFFTTKKKGKGTGLGLATCLAIVEGLGGCIRITTAPERGTTFTVDLPSCDEPAYPLDADWPVPPAGHGEVVLVVEDDPALRRAIARVLGQAGYAVRTAATGPEALREIDTLGPRLQLVLSDVVMPGVGGYDLADYLARVCPSAAVLLTSGYPDEAPERDPLHALPILWKPVPPRELLHAVAQALLTREASRSKG